MRLNEVTGETGLGSANSKKGQMSRLAKQDGPNAGKEKSQEKPESSYQSMEETEFASKTE